MSNIQVSPITQEEEIPCMLLPLVGITLLVPNVSVAEMAPIQPLSRQDHHPTWMLGFYDWRERQVPVLSYEVLSGQEKPRPNPRGRIAVLNNTGVSDTLPFIAITTEGIPRMVRVSSEDIIENDEKEKKAYDLMTVVVGMENLVVPNITALEKAYLTL